jgi:peptidoglycan/xylan/chitin deacetylase (PgdA/CDA1 family)
MRSLLLAAAAFISVLSLSACATRPQEQAAAAKLAFAPERPMPAPDIMSFPGPRRGLAGRTIRVSRPSDIVLARGEVVLTFDDGPYPGRTGAILDTLDAYGVKATFFMVGSMAKAHPAEAREVAAHGHTIGSHTQDHRNLASMAFDAAVEDIEKGRRNIAAATGKSVPFFRFPYLAATPALRRQLASQGIVEVSPTVDSKDYFSSTPDQVRARTMAALKRRGSGVILFHDIQKRTVTLLPAFLEDLKANGFSVARLAPGSSAVDAPLVAAAGPIAIPQ